MSKKNFLSALLIILIAVTFCGCKKGDKVMFLDPVFNKIEIENDIVYATAKNEEGKEEPLKLDIYQPLKDLSSTRPLIVWVHGGGFKEGDKKDKGMVQLCKAFAKRGYIAVSINYRLRKTPMIDIEDTIADTVADTVSALDYLKSNASKYRINISQIIIGGSSAGGITALYAAYKENQFMNKIFAVINLWGALYDNSNITSRFPPTIIIHGTNDHIVPYQYSIELSDKLKMLGITYELHPIEDEGHAPWKYTDEIINWVSHFLFNLID